MHPNPLKALFAHPRQALQRVHWGWTLAVGLLLGGVGGWLLITGNSAAGWVGVALLLTAALWLGRDASPRLSAPLVRPRVKPGPLLPRVVMDQGLEMVELPAGEFMMGSPADDEMALSRERPQHRVRLSGFRIARTPVTLGLYREVIGHKPDSEDHQGRNQPELPVVDISWSDAIAFCNALSALRGYRPCYRRSRLPWLGWRCDWAADGYRLPSEAEWEYACRAGTRTRWSFGDDQSGMGDHAWFGEGSEGTAHPVGTKRASPWGLYDMHGNVWEWCWDYYGSYWLSGRRNPHGVWFGRSRVLRGGSFWDSPENLRSAVRVVGLPEVRVEVIGFRCVRIPARQP